MIPFYDDQPTRIKPWATIALIVICCFVFLWQKTLSSFGFGQTIVGLGLTPSTLAGFSALPDRLTLVPPEFTVLTSMFLHGGWLHLGGNMLYLWIFGNNVEDSMGHGMFVVFYLLCGSLAALVQVFSDPTSNIPMVGASGAVAGTLGAYLLLHPRARILTFVFLGIFWTFIRLPALVVLLGWIALQIFNALGTQPGTGGVAWLAHVGGFFSGAILIGLFKYRSVSFFNASRKGPWGRN